MIDKFPRAHRQFKELHKFFDSKGYDLRIVGGAVRDILQNKEPDDLDFCTNAPPDEMVSWYCDEWRVAPTGLHHGTVTFFHRVFEPLDPEKPFGFVRNKEEGLEVTTLRKDVLCDGRWAEVEFTDNWEEDAARRDFTFNAMSMDIEGNVYDYFNGEEDIKNGKVRFVGNAEERIQEDALRMMRLIRFICAVPGDKFTNCVDEETVEAVTKNAALIKDISVERVWNEFKKACKKYPSGISGKFMYFLDSTGLSCELEWPVGNFLSHHIDHKYIAKFPTLAVAPHILYAENVEPFFKKFKLKRIERKELAFFQKYTNADYKVIDLTFEHIEDLIVEGVDREWIKAVCSYHGQTYHEHYAHTCYKAEFPIKAADLLAKYDHLKEGRKLGNIVKKCEAEWKRTRYKKNREQLLKESEQWVS